MAMKKKAGKAKKKAPAKKDDGKTQPSGASGPPIVCGVIQLRGGANEMMVK